MCWVLKNHKNLSKQLKLNFNLKLATPLNLTSEVLVYGEHHRIFFLSHTSCSQCVMSKESWVLSQFPDKEADMLINDYRSSKQQFNLEDKVSTANFTVSSWLPILIIEYLLLKLLMDQSIKYIQYICRYLIYLQLNCFDCNFIVKWRRHKYTMKGRVG